jgi:hypothetical protein
MPAGRPKIHKTQDEKKKARQAAQQKYYVKAKM